jgi:hypothetical protein
MERRRRGTRPPYKVIGPVTLMVMALIGIGLRLHFREPDMTRVQPRGCGQVSAGH